MRRIAMLLVVFLLFSAAVFAGESKAPVSTDRVERQAGDVRVVVYMTTW